jgi:hypothetical protein
MTLENTLLKIRNKALTIFGDVLLNRHFPWIPYYKPEGYSIRGEHIRRLLDICLPGDVLLRGYDDYMDGLFIGEWSHAAMVLNKTQVIHAMAEGVKTDDLLDFFRTDRVMVLRPTRLSIEEIQKVLDKAYSRIGSKYDFGFNFDDPKELCCTELVYFSFEDYVDKLGMYKETENFFGSVRETIRPALFTRFHGFFKVVELPQ